MYHDDKVYENYTDLTYAWNEKLKETIPRIIGEVANYAGVEAEAEAELIGMGSFNIVYKVSRFRGIYRFPILGKSAFRYEKTNDECMIMQYLSRHTSIPIPRLIAAKACEVGPYLVMACADGKDLSNYLEAQRKFGERPALNPDIDLTTLAKAYGGMAEILIELSQCRFSYIGGLGRNTSKEWCVTKRPITLNMNQIVSCGNYPVKALPQQAFTTANEYFTSLAETHLTHLRTQRNDAVDDEEDARKKYVARCLFLKIAKNFSTQNNTGPFPLYCDDLRPSNVLVNEDMIVCGVIDWEYCYAAPVEFTYCSPWWLLLQHPDDWRDGDLGTFFEQYLPRHKIFIQILREKEKDLVSQGKLAESQCLSTKMAESISNGHFWFCLAATSSYGFDDIYWKFVDPLYYGSLTSIEDRIQLLTQQERDDLEPFVQLKIQQAKEGTVEEHWTLEEMCDA